MRAARFHIGAQTALGEFWGRRKRLPRAPEPAAIPIDGRLRGRRVGPIAPARSGSAAKTHRGQIDHRLAVVPLVPTISCRPSSSGAACAPRLAQRPRSPSRDRRRVALVRILQRHGRIDRTRQMVRPSFIFATLASGSRTPPVLIGGPLLPLAVKRASIPRRGLDVRYASLPPYPVARCFAWRRWLPRWWAIATVRLKTGGHEALLDPRDRPMRLHIAATGEIVE